MSDVMPDSDREDSRLAIPMDQETFGKWQRRIDQARRLREPFIDEWKDAVQAYLGKPLLKAPEGDTVIVNKELAFTEQKKAQLIFQPIVVIP